MPLQVLLLLNPYPDTVPTDDLKLLIGGCAVLQAEGDALINASRFPPVSSVMGNLVLDVPHLISETEQRCLRHADALERELRAEADAQGVTLSIARTADYPGEFASHAAVAARYRNLTILLHDPASEASTQMAETLVFGAGRPVLLLPRVPHRLAVDHLAIAWDGSRVAARALADALTIVPQTARITVLTVSDEKVLRKSTGEKLTDALKRSGRNAELLDAKARGRPIGQALQDTAMTAGAGMIAMGGYGHSRLREFVLGGATAGLLADLRLPTVMSH